MTYWKQACIAMGLAALIGTSAGAAVIDEDFETDFGSFQVSDATAVTRVANPDGTFTDGGDYVVEISMGGENFQRIYRDNDVVLDPTKSYTLSLDVYNLDAVGQVVRIRDGDLSETGNVDVTDTDYYTATPASDLFTTYSTVIGPASDPNAKFTYTGTTDNVYTIRIESNRGTGYVDNVKLELVPEPASMGLLAVGSLALLRRRRR
jgi:hypothetical protein